MKRKKSTVIVFFVIEILLFVTIVMVFAVPLMNLNINFEKFYDEKTKNYVDGILQTVINGDVISLNDEFIKKSEEVEDGFKMLDQYFANNGIESVKLIDCSFETFLTNNEKTKTTFFTYDVKLKNGFGILNIETYEINDTIKLNRFYLNPMEKSASETHNFYGYEIPGARLCLLILIVLLNVFVMYTEYDYFKNSAEPKVWMQIVMMLSIIAIGVNWTTLTPKVQLLSVSLFPVAASSPGIAGEWSVTYFLPVMAILYWTVLRKKEILRKKESDAQDAEHIA